MTPVTRLRPGLLFVLGLLSALTPFAIDMYLPGIPAMARDLDAGVELAQISVTVYLAVFALAQLALGPLSDVYGRRRIIGGGLLVFVIADIGCAFAATMPLMLGARAVQAIGGAAVAVTVPALVRDLFARDDYARVMGLVMLIMGMAPLIAPSVGGLIILYGSWRWVFAALLLIALISGGLFFRFVPETLTTERRHRLNAGHILGNYGILLRHRAALGYLLSGAASFGGMMIFIVTSPYIYIELHGIPPSLFGPLFGVNILAAMLFTLVNSKLVPRVGAERMLRFGLAVQVSAALALVVLAVPGHPDLWLIAVGSGVYISMAGIVMGNAMAGFMAFFPQMAGTASAFAGAIRFGFGALAATFVSLLHDDTARPLLLGMGVCGLLAAGIYRLACGGDSPGGGVSKTREQRAATDAGVP
jgi:DHA1 family bicyclomycin/chloramphenicol resistance-like MFS transporter